VIDTHCHLLWRIDDGPRSAMEALDLARLLFAQGVRAVVCTPHYSTRFPTRASTARARLGELRRNLAAVEVPLRTALAAEVAHALALTVPADQLRERSIAGRVLVELDADAPASAPVRVSERLAGFGLGVIFAHPERAPSVRSDRDALDEARSAGAAVQLVVSSLAGRWGPEVERSAWDLLDAGCVDLVASDAHNATGSAQLLRRTLDQVARRYGGEAVTALSEVNPQALLAPGESASF
jgi:protein-tyrosine phosphatase